MRRKASNPPPSELEDNILVLALVQEITTPFGASSDTFILVPLTAGSFVCRVGLGPVLFGLFCISLLLSLNLLKSEELLTVT